MPTMQAMTSRANLRFAPGASGIDGIQAAQLAPPGTNLPAQATALGIATTTDEENYLASFPVGQLAALQAALLSAVHRQLAVTFAWAPAYAHQITIWDVAGTPQSPGGMTVFVRSPLPPQPG